MAMFPMVAILIFCCILSSDISKANAEDGDLAIRLLQEMEYLKLQQTKITTENNKKFEKLNEKITESKEKYDQLSAEILDLKKEQDQRSKHCMCKSILEKVMIAKSEHEMDPGTHFRAEELTKVDSGNNFDIHHPNNRKNNTSIETSEGIWKPSVPVIQKRATTPIRVAFYADLTHRLDFIARRYTVVFDRIKTNVGNGYNSHDGIFTAPVSGVYVFSWYGVATLDRDQDLSIMVDGQAFATSFISDANMGSSSKTAVMDLNQGARVWIRTSETNGVVDLYQHNSFAGWLLYKRDT